MRLLNLPFYIFLPCSFYSSHTGLLNFLQPIKKDPTLGHLCLFSKQRVSEHAQLVLSLYPGIYPGIPSNASFSKRLFLTSQYYLPLPPAKKRHTRLIDTIQYQYSNFILCYLYRIEIYYLFITSYSLHTRMKAP